MVISFILSLIVIIVDQLTKKLIYLTPSRSIIGNLLWFESTFNTGVAFSMFSGKVVLFSIVSIIASGFFIFLIIDKNIIKYKSEKIVLGIILGGAFSNLIDRIFLGGVRDFIYLKFINFAIFNVADMAVSIGAVVFCILYFVHDILFPYLKNKNSSQAGETYEIQTFLEENENNIESSESENKMYNEENNLSKSNETEIGENDK